MMYEWIKALHVVSIIAWMAGLLYLPRLYVYHCKAEAGSDLAKTLKVMERRLLRAIMNPAMIASWGFGLWLMVLIEAWTLPWFHAKLLAVLLMTGAHMAMAKWRKDFEADRNQRSEKFYRIVNEVPTLLMIAVVILVIVKPI